jgi:zinc transporter ZupT
MQRLTHKHKAYLKLISDNLKTIIFSALLIMGGWLSYYYRPQFGMPIENTVLAVVGAIMMFVALAGLMIGLYVKRWKEQYK